jgi:DNA-directed RNA polymerase subunit RPC12/RpoP
MANTNCLKGIRCPECGQEGKFEIQISAYIDVTDEGTGDLQSAIEWDKDSDIVCKECGHDGTVEEFTTTNEAEDNA